MKKKMNGLNHIPDGNSSNNDASITAMKNANSHEDENSNWKACVMYRISRIEISFVLFLIIFVSFTMSSYFDYNCRVPNQKYKDHIDSNQITWSTIKKEWKEMKQELDELRSQMKSASNHDNAENYLDNKKYIGNTNSKVISLKPNTFIKTAASSEAIDSDFMTFDRRHLQRLASDPTAFTSDNDQNNTCMETEYDFLLQTELDANGEESRIILRNDDTSQSYQLNSLFEPPSYINTSSTSNRLYFACLPYGIYSIVVHFFGSQLHPCAQNEAEIGSCYNIYVHQNLIIQSPLKFTNEQTHGFAINMYGNLNTRLCNRLPSLSDVENAINASSSAKAERVRDLIQSVSAFESLNFHKSPQYKAACWILFDTNLELHQGRDFFKERYALATLLYSFNFNAELILPEETCDMDGISCNEDGHVTEVTFSKMMAKGTIPSEISLLSHLETLDLQNNQITGTIPVAIGSLFQLQTLNLSFNQLVGTIPTEISLCSKMEILRIHANQLTGTMPSELYNCLHLNFLTISQNKLTGTIPSDNLKGLSQMSLLDLWENDFTGSIPNAVWELPSLTWFYANDNRLTGSIPAEIGNVHDFQVIFLQNNQLSGTLPNVFGNLTSLTWMDFSQNQFTGTIPDSIWNSSHWEILQMQRNNFRGTVPDHFCSLKSLDRFNVDRSSWFRDSAKVDCECCGTTAGCYIWNPEHMMCPQSNKKHLSFVFSYFATDRVVNTTFTEFFGLSREEKDICLSPTGCYTIEYFTDDTRQNRASYSLSYSARNRSLVQQDQCDAVEICGTTFDSNHPRRSFLNHITQTLIFDFANFSNDPSAPRYEALCWILLEDSLFDDNEICDGTLMQRYILAQFFLQQSNYNNDFHTFSSLPTCQWPDITCDESFHKFVEHMNFSNKMLHGKINTEIGHLIALKTLDFSGNSLSGSLVSEIGNLINLQSLNLSHNKLVGSLTPAMFTNLGELSVLELGHNQITGEIPKELLELPQILRLNLMKNTLVGEFPDFICPNKTLEFIHLGENLLRGSISDSFFDCKNLKYIDLSVNELSGTIPSAVGNLEKLEALKLNRNRISGSIPVELSYLSQIRLLMVHNNELTGSIPTVLGNLQNISLIFLSHNSFKGTLPPELSNLSNLKKLHVHDNKLTGIAPAMTFIEHDKENFIADCAEPFYLLSAPLICDSCSMCCNSDGICQDKNYWSLPIWISVVIWVVAVPVIFIAIYVAIIMKRSWICLNRWIQNRDPTTVYSEESVYCLILGSDPKGWIIYFITAFVQVSLFTLFLMASSDKNADSDYKFTFYCSDSTRNCEDENTVDLIGRALFFIVILIFLGQDLGMSLLQVHQSHMLGDVRLLLSGLSLLCFSLLALVTSFIYNEASGSKNTDMIKDAVVLLFFSDLDECLMSALTRLFPVWVENQLKQIKRRIMIENQSFIGTDKRLSEIRSEIIAEGLTDFRGSLISIQGEESSKDIEMRHENLASDTSFSRNDALDQ